MSNTVRLTSDKKPTYLSPSSLMNFYTQPWTFYLNKMRSDKLYPREPQGFAAGVGTAFDIKAKEYLLATGQVNSTIGIGEIKKSLDEYHFKKCMDEGEKIMNLYKTSRAIKKHDWRLVELHKRVPIEGVPILGQLDAVVWDKDFGGNVPLDFKVSGANSKTGVSPKKGYFRIFDGKEWKPQHKIYHPDIAVEEIDKKWGIQFCTYGWLLGIPVGKPFPVYFDHPVYNGKDKILKIAQYKAMVTEEFQSEVLEMYQTAWREINDGSFLERLNDEMPVNNSMFRSEEDLLDVVLINALNENWF